MIRAIRNALFFKTLGIGDYPLTHGVTSLGKTSREIACRREKWQFILSRKSIVPAIISGLFVYSFGIDFGIYLGISGFEFSVKLSEAIPQCFWRWRISVGSATPIN